MDTAIGSIAILGLFLFLFPPIIWWACDQWERIVRDIRHWRKDRRANGQKVMVKRPREFRLIPRKRWLTLANCPVGMFMSEYGTLCIKTEYGNNEGRID